MAVVTLLTMKTRFRSYSSAARFMISPSGSKNTSGNLKYFKDVLLLSGVSVIRLRRLRSLSAQLVIGMELSHGAKFYGLDNPEPDVPGWGDLAGQGFDEASQGKFTIGFPHTLLPGLQSRTENHTYPA
ncbi:hypothetical protein NHQ30_011209 [Ciborinia camelliae]|nr:hypothetical protein NHQ30_011209 [Ciborinia camelliae]